MTQEEKELLLKDLCGRLPYGVQVETTWAIPKTDVAGYIGRLTTTTIELFDSGELLEVKPYLRPMSSMTEDEKEEYFKVCDADMNALIDGASVVPIIVYGIDHEIII